MTQPDDSDGQVRPIGMWIKTSEVKQLQVTEGMVERQ